MTETATIPFQIIDWSSISKTIHPGETGVSFWKMINYPGLRIRIVDYSAGYLADHWCRKGHVVYCLEGEMESELQTGEIFQLAKGMSYVVSDGMSSHRSISKTGVKLLIIDGNFLQ